MPTRLEALEKMVAAGVDNPMAWYGLAMEYRGAKRFDEALRAFERTREKYPAYVAQYLMAAQMLHELARDGVPDPEIEAELVRLLEALRS